MEALQSDPELLSSISTGSLHNNEKYKRKIKAFFSFLNPFLFGLLLVGGFDLVGVVVWWWCGGCFILLLLLLQ